VLDLLLGSDEELVGKELTDEFGLEDEVNELNELLDELEVVDRDFSI
jgi:hypothetical protein